MTFGEILKELRKKKGLTQVQFAEIFNISKGTIAMWEINQRQPDKDTLSALADYFKVSVDYLLGREEKSPVLMDEVDLDDHYAVPLLGSVVAGIPIEAQENLEGYIYISYRPKEEYFAMLNGEQTVKRFKLLRNNVVLMPENPDYDPIFVTERDELLILGKVMEVRVKF